MVASTSTSNGNRTAATTTEYEGTVARVNERGIRFRDREGWVNISKFAGSVELPAVGQRARCTLDGAGFIRALVVVAPTAPEPAQNRGTGAQDTPAEPP